MTEYNPDTWVVLKCLFPNGPVFRILAGWSGGYLDGDSWRLNSTIERIEEDDKFYYVHGSSGSVYKLHKEMEQFSVITAGIFEQIVEQSEIEVKTVSMLSAITEMNNAPVA